MMKKTALTTLTFLSVAVALTTLSYLACSNEDPGPTAPDLSKIPYDTLVDARDEAVYRAVRIGNRTWMAENLNYQTSGNSWCYGNEASNCAVYGRLYSWDAAVSACSGFGVGWRLPTRADWDDLVLAAGDSGTAGGRLKSYRGWGNGGGRDDFGFSAMPGGNRVLNNFTDAGSRGYWWSVTEDASGNAYYRSMDRGAGVVELDGGKSRGLSVRCVRN